MADEVSGEIIPSHAYTFEHAAKLIGCSRRRLVEDMIDTGELAVARRGRFIGLVMGHSIINWVERNMDYEKART